MRHDELRQDQAFAVYGSGAEGMDLCTDIRGAFILELPVASLAPRPGSQYGTDVLESGVC